MFRVVLHDPPASPQAQRGRRVTLARKSKSGLVPVREPSGRLLRSIETAIDAKAPSEVRRLRDAACARMAAPEWGTELGRLYLAGKIGPKLFETGKRLSNLLAAYRRAISSPPEAPGSAAFAGQGRKTDADPESDEGQRQAVRDTRVVAAATEALAILSSAGREKLNVVLGVCERNEMPPADRGMANLLIGLGYIAQHWGIIDLAPKRRKDGL